MPTVSTPSHLIDEAVTHIDRATRLLDHTPNLASLTAARENLDWATTVAEDVLGTADREACGVDLLQRIETLTEQWEASCRDSRTRESIMFWLDLTDDDPATAITPDGEGQHAWVLWSFHGRVLTGHGDVVLRAFSPLGTQPSYSVRQFHCLWCPPLLPQRLKVRAMVHISAEETHPADARLAEVAATLWTPSESDSTFAGISTSLDAARLLL